MLEAGPASLTIANRTVSRAAELRERFRPWGDVEACSFGTIDTSRDYHLLINATSAGVKGESLPYPLGAVRPSTVCYDLSYGLEPTPFCRWAATSYNFV